MLPIPECFMRAGMSGQPLLPKTAPFTSDQITALNGIMAAFTTEQRSWLSGFLVGYQAGQMTGVAAPPAAQAKIPLTILYATESGNAEGVAANARKAAAKLASRRPSWTWRRRSRQPSRRPPI